MATSRDIPTMYVANTSYDRARELVIDAIKAFFIHKHGLEDVTVEKVQDDDFNNIAFYAKAA